MFSIPMTYKEAASCWPINPEDFYGIPEAIVRAIEALEMDEDPDPKTIRRLKMAYTASLDML
jgi:hypothetical protein